MEKGFVIVGMMKYYNYFWNDEVNCVVRVEEEVFFEDENVMLVKFVESYDL